MSKNVLRFVCLITNSQSVQKAAFLCCGMVNVFLAETAVKLVALLKLFVSV